MYTLSMKLLVKRHHFSLQPPLTHNLIQVKQTEAATIKSIAPYTPPSLKTNTFLPQSWRTSFIDLR